MKRTILVRGARQLLTLRGPTGPRRGDAMRDLGLIEDGSLLIVNGVIDSVGPTRRIENLSEARSAEEINASGHVVMPGFIDSHTHLIAPPPRSIDYGLREDPHSLNRSEVFTPGIQYIRTTPAGTLEFQARRYLENAIRHGTTTLEAKSGHALNAAGEIKMLRVLAALGNGGVSIVPTFFGASALPPEFDNNADAYIESLCKEQMPRIVGRRLAEFADVLCDPGCFTIDRARTYLECARRLGLGRKIHGEQRERMGTVQLALEFDATSIDGLNEADRSDAELLARSRTIATLLPGFVQSGSARGFPPARELLDAGAAVALASGFHPTVNSTYNMQTVVSLACMHMNMTPEEAISAATINAAHAVSRASRCGSLEFGKDADIVILRASDYREITHHFGSNSAALVLRKGQVVYREGAIAWARA